MTGADFFRGCVCMAIAAIGGYMLNSSGSLLVSFVAIFVLVTYGSKAFGYWGIK